MIKSQATIGRIYYPSVYKAYLFDKACGLHTGKRKRLRQAIKANIINGNSEYRFIDWCLEQDKYEKNWW